MILNQLKKDQYIEIFDLDNADDSIFGNYQRYDFFQIIWFTEVGGDPTYFLDFQEYTLKEDQIVIVYPGQIDRMDIQHKKGYLFAINSDTFFNINRRLNSDFLNGYLSNIFITLNDSVKKTLEILLDLMLSEYRSKNRIILMESYLEAFLFHINSLLGDTTLSKNNQATVVAELMKLIDYNYITERETKFYAKELGLTIRRLSELTQKGTGKTVKEHLHERLILEAKREIHLNRKSLKEIAFDLGFNEPAYFTRFFKQHTTMTPSEFKDKAHLSK